MNPVHKSSVQIGLGLYWLGCIEIEFHSHTVSADRHMNFPN